MRGQTSVVAWSDVANGVVPDPVREKIPAGQSPHARVKLAQKGDCVGAESLHRVVGRHQGNSTDVDAACPGANNFESGIGSIRL